MATVYFLLFTALIFPSAALTIRAYYAEQVRQVYFFKPATMILIIGLALFGGNAPFSFYGLMILAGFVFSTAGDVLLIPEGYFKQGLISFLLAHVCYIIAFAQTSFSIITLLPFLLFSLWFVATLWQTLSKMRIPVMVYAVVIALMGWLAIERWLALETTESFLAAVGAIIFIVSDTVLAYDRFKHSFNAARALVLSTYFVAQWLIALSV